MEGLDASVIALSAVKQENRDVRLDSAYFSPAALAAEALIAARNPKPISEVSADVLSFGAYALTNEYSYVDEGIPFLRGADFAGDFVNFGEVLRITPQAHDLLHKSQVHPGMVLLSMSGSVGSVAVALDNWPYPINSNQDIAKIIPEGIDPFYLASFLGSDFGRAQVERLPVGSVQQHIFLWMIERIQVPRFPVRFEAEIAAITRDAYETYEAAGRHFHLAEEVMTASLGLGDWVPPEPLSYVASASDVAKAARLDAQYFMPAKEGVRLALAALPGRTLGERVESIREMFIPERAPPDILVRNYDVTDALVPLLDPQKPTSRASEVGSTKKSFRTGDVVISRLRAYLREIAVVRASDDIRLIGSSEFIVLRPLRGISPSAEALMIFLRSRPAQTFLKWCQDGSQHPRFSERDLLSIPVPDAVIDAAAEVEAIVKQGFVAQGRAKQLMRVAKRSVELAIERGEADEAIADAFISEGL